MSSVTSAPNTRLEQTGRWLDAIRTCGGETLWRSVGRSLSQRNHMWKVLLTLIVMFVCSTLASAVLARQAKVLVSTPADLPQSALSPESCLSEIDELNAQAYREAIGSGQEVDRTGLRHRSKMIASKCASSYSFASVRQEQLPALSRLYFVAGQPSRAYNAVSRYLKLPLISKTAKAELLLRTIGFSIAYVTNSGNAAEAYIKRLDSLGDDFVRQRISGHLQLAKHYLTSGRGADAFRHEAAIINLSGKLKPDERKTTSAEVVNEIIQLSMIQCSEEGPSKALAILRQILPELVSLSGAEPEVEVGIARYLLVGQPVPPIAPKYVLNNAGGAGDLEMRGRVTVMVFAAHWCGPCRVIYPQAASLYERYRDDGLRVVLVTQLYGFFGDRKGLKPEDEVAAVRDHYAVEMKIPFPILIEDSSHEGRSGRVDSGASVVRHEYLFSFLPQVLVIDKSGTTRAILLGTLPGQGDRLRTKVEELLKESP